MVLCYNKESGKLYHANSAPATDVLFNSYEDKGFKESEKMHIGYIKHKGTKLSKLGEIYIDALKNYENKVL